MATSSALSASSEQTEVHRLKSGSLGLVGILLLAFSSAAPWWAAWATFRLRSPSATVSELQPDSSSQWAYFSASPSAM